MNCSCIVQDIGDHATVHTERVVTSRKERKCCECGGAIHPGDRYEYVWGIWDDRKHTHATCSICLEIRNAFFCGWIYGMLWEDLAENFYEDRYIPWATVGELFPEARDIFCDWVERVLWDDEDEPCHEGGSDHE